jgi:hypothetical protein
MRTSQPRQSGRIHAAIQATGRQDGTVEADRDLIKSRERVRDLAEVYTHKREVDAMLDLIPDMFKQIDSRFLEPACGDGNFLVEILARKIALITEKKHGGTPHWYEFAVLRCVASIYAVDISEENGFEAHERMRAVIEKEFAEKGFGSTPAFHDALTVILNANVVHGDTLKDARQIKLIEWQAGPHETFVRTPTFLEEPEHDLFYVAPAPLAPIHYSELTPEVLL